MAHAFANSIQALTEKIPIKDAAATTSLLEELIDVEHSFYPFIDLYGFSTSASCTSTN